MGLHEGSALRSSLIGVDRLKVEVRQDNVCSESREQVEVRKQRRRN